MLSGEGFIQRRMYRSPRLLSLMSALVITILGVLAILPHIVHPQQNLVYAQTTASVSIVQGSSRIFIS